jgi:tetratricopeptide (TPR) repeat protein
MTNFNAHFYLGVIYEKKKEYKKSITLFKQCLNNDKQHFGACIHLATLLANAGEA